MSSGKPVDKRLSAYLARFAPGLRTLLSYDRADLPHDLVAGLSVACIALPVGVAYAQLAGFGPEVGLYSSILPLLAYALLGTSRQLIVGPDSATCALAAASFLPRVPAPLAVMALAAVAAKLLGLDGAGVKIIGPVPAGLPPLRIPAAAS